MKKLSNKIKSIYTLSAILVLSLCMMLFPASSKPASAEEIAGAANTIKVYSAYVQVSKQVDENSEFAIMFKAKITKDAYNTITNNGQANVKFGLLVGPTDRMENVSDYDTAIAQDFEAISTVGTRSSGAYQHVSFRDSEEVFYSAGILYNKEKLEDLAQEKGVNSNIEDLIKDVAAIELTAIPFYTIDGQSYAVIDNQQNCVPKEVLAETYVKELDNNITNIPEAVVTAFAGQVNEVEGEHYVCRDTGRLMSASVKGGDLVPVTFSSSEVESVFVYSKKQSDITESKLDDNYLQGLPMYNTGSVVVYKKNGTIDKYSATLAERVITRFSDTTVGQTATNTTKDYLATATDSSYQSIFTLSKVENLTNSAISSNSYIYAYQNKYEGLYVLANDITFPTTHQYVLTEFTTSTPTNVACINKKDDQGKYTNEGWYAKSSFLIPEGNAGFLGTFDGRGKVIDANAKATNGILPPAFNATIKNTAFVNLQSSTNYGGICGSARNSTFENIYATVTSVADYKGDLSGPIAMTFDNCNLRNFVVEANTITSDVMTGTLSYGVEKANTYNNKLVGVSGFGQGRRTSGVFTFKNFPDVFVDDQGNCHYVEAVTSSTRGLNNFNLAGSRTYLGKIYTSNNVVTTRHNFYNTKTDAFAGTTGVNVYAVGSSPLFINHETEVATGTGSDYLNRPSLDPISKTTVFVNNTLKYKTGATDETADTNTTDFYKLSSLVDTDGLFTINSDTNYSLGEIILRGKQYRFGEDKVAAMLATEATNELEVRLVTQDGFYDVKDYTEMASFVQANTETPFDATYWTVSNGIVSWKGL